MAYYKQAVCNSFKMALLPNNEYMLVSYEVKLVSTKLKGQKHLEPFPFLKQSDESHPSLVMVRKPFIYGKVCQHCSRIQRDFNGHNDWHTFLLCFTIDKSN